MPDRPAQSLLFSLIYIPASAGNSQDFARRISWSQVEASFKAKHCRLQHHFLGRYHPFIFRYSQVEFQLWKSAKDLSFVCKLDHCDDVQGLTTYSKWPITGKYGTSMETYNSTFGIFRVSTLYASQPNYATHAPCPPTKRRRGSICHDIYQINVNVQKLFEMCARTNVISWWQSK